MGKRSARGNRMKLYGKKLDVELAKRKHARENRRNQGLTLRNAAKQQNIDILELMEYEYGYFCCPHKKWEYMLAGIPIPKFIFKRCIKCGKVDEKSMEEVYEKNLEKVYKIFKRIMDKNGKTVKKEKTEILKK